METGGYTIQETLHQGKRFMVYRAIKNDDGTSWILKVLNQAYQGTSGKNASEHEYRLLTLIDSEYVIKVHDYLRDQDNPMVVLEDIGGRDLNATLATSGPFSLDRFLELAIAITKGLAAVHQQHVIHKDLNPSNIIRNPETGMIKIIDFDIAAQYDLKMFHAGNPEHLQGTLPYISPEQTGRMNRTVDLRSDLYSLGVTFYEMLTGQRPFESRDPMELVHAHLAKMPVPPHEISLPEEQNKFCTPKILSDIIMKLLAKDPEDRYQSAEGVKYDLEQVQANRSDLEDLTGFTPGIHDFSDKLHIPEKLYGREQEIRQLLEAYQRVTQGNRELILVAGYSGTGKTALVSEIHKPITRDRGYFVRGKFEQLQRNIPYFAFIQAISQFCNLLLTEPQPVLVQWKQTILEAVGSLGKVLTDIIPNLEAVIGKQPEVLQVGGTEAKNRFNYVFRQFIRAISTTDHPLVMFLDDLQWTDRASLDLLKLLMTDAQNQYFLCIGAYRDNEVSEAHPLMVMTAELQTQKVPMTTIPVNNLNRQDIEEWVAGTLRGGTAPELSAIDALAECIHRKTRGNAFFTVQFLSTLYQERLLQFDVSRSTWTWEQEAVERLAITENVVDLLLHRLRLLSADVRATLRLAACIGNIFDSETLTVISDNVHHDRESLDTAVREQLFVPLDEQNYQFSHDRIQEAAYALIPESEKAPLHLKIGRRLLQEFHLADETDALQVPEETEQHIFTIVKHVNLALDLIQDETEKLTAARLNLLAARKAKAATAYHPAWNYIQKAIQLLPGDSWQIRYAFTLTVYQEAIQLAYLSSHYESISRLGDTVVKSAINVMDKATVYEYQIMSAIAENHFAQAVDTALEIFDNLGITIPRKPGEEDMTIFAETKALLEEKGIEGLKYLPPMQDEEKQLALRLYLRASAAIVFVAQDLFPFIANKMLLFSLHYGKAPETAYVLGEYGLLNIFTGNISDAYKYSSLSKELLEKLDGFESMKMRSLTVHCIYIVHWKLHYSELAERFWELHQRGINAGDLEWSSFALLYHFLLQRYIGRDLALVESKGKNFLEVFDQFKQPVVRMTAEIWFQMIRNLTGANPNPMQLQVDPTAFLPVITEDIKRMVQFNSAPSQLLLNCLFEKYEIVDCSETLQQSPILTATIEYPNYIFYLTLLQLQVIKQTEPSEKQNLLDKVRKGLKQIQTWADLGPKNFLHRLYLLQAELAALDGNLYEAGEFYDKAIETAHKNQFLCDEALANEYAAKFYLLQNRESLTAFYFQRAWLCYRKWGATAKVKHLEEHYPKYIHPSTRRPGTTSSETTGELLDVGSILKASQTLSGEVQLENLLEKMMQILIENAGAQRGVFIEQRDEQLLIQAEGTPNGVSGMLRALPVEEAENLPLAVINYVAHSKEHLVFDNISKDTTYSTDPYIQQHQPTSMVCFPVLKQSELAGMLYLENNLVEGAFTPARLEVLNMLSAQIAISIENAELYENLEEKVRQRTHELQQAHEKLEKSHKDITDSVNYASRIQQAVLPTQEIIAELFPEHFILYKPCAVVSGDFYWVKQLENTVVVATVDCTGHGVSGALVSMLGMAFLNEIVPLLDAQSQLTAGNILNELRTRVKIALKQTGKPGEQKEGMDIALCILEPTNNQLHYAGAYNPLYIIRDRQLLEVKADRMPIGIHRKERPFSSHDLPFQHGDMLYLFTDGLVDQAGEQGIGGFSKKRFQQLLLDIHHEPMSKQKELLLRRFEEWKGNLPQTDDLLIVGIRL